MTAAREARARWRVVVADDEPHGREAIRLALDDAPDFELVGEAADGEAAVAAVRRHRPDLLFLDIRMPDRDGFQVLDAIEEDARPHVVFVTAYDEYALRAFEHHAVDYLLKPVEDERFEATLDHVRERLREGAADARALVAAVLEELGLVPDDTGERAGTRRGAGGGSDAAHRDPMTPGAASPVRPVADDADGSAADDSAHAAAGPARPTAGPYATRLMVREGEHIRFVPVADVRWFEADGNYVILHRAERTHRIRSTMTALEERLDPARFVRVHRSSILNLDRLDEVQPWFSGDYLAILDDGTHVRVSRRYRDRLLRDAF